MGELPRIVLLSESPTTELHWRKLLGTNYQVLRGSDLPADDPWGDIVVTDFARQHESSPTCELARDHYGLIAIGVELPADVAFSETPTERELRLACDLLYKIVQLRRERAASQHTHRLLTEIAELDALTGVANRRAWDAELARRMTQLDGDATICLALLDLDHFKDVNTLYGYAAADKVLQQVGNALKASVRSEDFVARIGGDEFGVLLSGISADRAETIVERIRTSIEPSLKRAGVTVVSVTAGLAVRQPDEDAEELFAAADANLRHGKAAGRNRTIASR
ncbi:MAG TPA: GGDEF domain-containing protein [Pirellulaceae bacterium]|nr:GGDEF domain-containing protein [Pirellulaceae bacterium]